MSLSPVELRHTLHKNPELSFKEFETTKLLIKNIESIDTSKKIKIHTPYKTGLLVEYKVNSDDFILFRADIDALPIKEQNDIEFKSTNDFMHACGHDLHTSILYGFIEQVIKSKIDKNILFLFQPAEESGGGAMEFYKTGIFSSFKIKNAFALHVTDEYKKGTIASSPGVLFASALEIDIEFFGKSSHVAFPYEGKNAFNALRTFLDIVDKIPGNLNEPVVFAPGKISAGDVRNIIPMHAKLECTLRALSEEKVIDYLNNLENILKGIKVSEEIDFKITNGAHYPEVVVNDELFENLSSKLSDKFPFINCGYKMTGEDFGFLSKKYPSFMFWLGTSTGKKYGLHNPKFLPDDSVIENGINIYKEILNSL